MRAYAISLLLTAALLCPAVAGADATVSQKRLTLEGAKQVAAAAVAAAHEGEGGSIAIVDEGGNLVYLERIDDTFPASANVSIGKARTAALFRRSTADFEEIIRGGRTPMIALAEFTPLQGGVPLAVGGRVVGAIGVSGAASQQRDETIAKAGAAALE